MNQDVGELFGQLKDQDPLMLGSIVGLLLSLVLAIVAGRAALGALGERRDLTSEYEATLAAIQQIKAMQKASPEGLNEGIAAAQAELDVLMSGVPSSEQVSEELVNYYGYANDLGTQLVRLEKTVPSVEGEPIDVYGHDLFLLEMHGEIPSLLRFLAQVGSGPYRTIMLDNIVIGPDSPAIAEADLTIYSSDYREPVGEMISPTLTVTPTQSVSSLAPADDVSRLLALMESALEEENWALVVASGRQLQKAGVEDPIVLQKLYLGHTRWAELLAEQGQTDEAIAEYRAALTIAPDGKDAQRALEQLEQQAEPTRALLASPVPLVVRATAIPRPAEIVATPTLVVHRVRSGESLLYLANRYQTSVAAIKRANALGGNVIYVGQELVIPAAGQDE